MRPTHACLLLVPFLTLPLTSRADTINTYTFTGEAGTDISVSLTFHVNPDGTASLPDVLAFTATTGSLVYQLQNGPAAGQVTVPATTYNLSDLKSFTFYPDPHGCADVTSRTGNGARVFPVTDTCDWLFATITSPTGRSLFLTDEFDPAIGGVELTATYAPFPTMEAFHGGFSSATFNSTAVSISDVPEPPTLHYSAGLAIAALGLTLTLSLKRHRAPALSALLLCWTAAQAQGPAPDQIPINTPYVTSPPQIVNAMLQLANVGKGDTVYDLGCGDGRIVISAAKQYGAKGVGIDINPDRIQEARANALNAGVTDRVSFEVNDLFESDIHNATVIAVYLLPEANLRLRARLLNELRPGTRVVSQSFDMGNWQPDKVIKVDGAPVYLWTIPQR